MAIFFYRVAMLLSIEYKTNYVMAYLDILYIKLGVLGNKISFKIFKIQTDFKTQKNFNFTNRRYISLIVPFPYRTLFSEEHYNSKNFYKICIFIPIIK